MLKLIRKHPLLTCLVIAIVLRLFAVVYSKGFMAHDDHFETVRVAYDGIQNGLLNDDNLMIWNTTRSEKIGRSPLYVLFLYSLMKAQESIGIYSLDSMMYFIRFVHFLLSLLLIFYGYKYVYTATGSKNYSMLAGLIMAGHFLMPYLAVRNLIELVSADLLLPAVFLAYRGVVKKDVRMLLISGVLSGLSWMIRFNTGLAILPIPFAIWFLSRNLRPALYYCFGILLIFIFSGSLDLLYLGSFGQSTVNIFNSFLHHVEHPLLPQPFWIYAVLVFGIFIPPFSFYFIVTAFRKKIWSGHLILFSSILIFFVIHSLIASKQERFMIPIFPLLVVIGTVGLHRWLESGKVSLLHKKIFRFSAIFAIVINLILLPVFIFNYAHKGMVEPFVSLSKQNDVNAVLIDRTERRRFMAYGYAGYNRPGFRLLDNWSELDEIRKESSLYDSINYFIIYTDSDPGRHVDSLTTVFGPIKQVFHSTPSTMDFVLHFLNPEHNHTNEAWIYKRTVKGISAGKEN
ncbi:MAG: hypothetical protein DRP51_10940 [Candidatus Zixiibacteriota bacterium]|nr:MAG: hypothetical protein DRP51_10940 [candidate division Zixibacteria bacterium]